MVNIIEAIEKTLQEQKDTIYIQRMQIDELKQKLAAAEAERDEMKGAKANV